MNQDPTSRVAGQVQPHLHLVADLAYPQINTADQHFIINELHKAPRVADNVAFSWQFLDAPPDGTILLVYQPPHKPQFWASDGYTWSQEQFFRHSYGDYVVEMFSASNGYNPAMEPRQGSAAAHCRQRFRMTPDPNNPQSKGNPSLWIVHYRRADRLLPATNIPITQHEQGSINARNYLKQLGHLQEKKFHLADAANWPTVTLPEQAAQHNALTFIGGQMANRMHMHLQQQQTAYNREHGPSPKRPRHGTNAAQRAAPPQPPQAAPGLDEEDWAEEDRRDVFDVLTQRDVSQMRFRNHEEWMEDVFSGYGTFDIKPVDLGFDRAGFMQPITDGFFNKPDRAPIPPNDAWKQTSEHYQNVTAKPFEAGKTTGFARAVEKRIADNNAQIAEMQRIHDERVKSLSRGSLLRDAAARIRGEQQSGQPRPKSSEGNAPTTSEPVSASKETSIEEIVKQVESLVGKRVISSSEVKLIQKGGFLEEIASKAQPGANGNGVGADQMTNLFDDFLETAPSAETSNKATPQPPLTSTTTAQQSASSTTQAEQSDDWVVVDKPPIPSTTTASVAPSTSQVKTSNLDLATDMVDYNSTPNADADIDAAASGGGAFDDAMHFDSLDTPGNDTGTPGFGPDNNDTADLTSAGALGQAPGTTSGAGGIGGGQDTPDVAMDDIMDESAFGDAFAATESVTAATADGDGGEGAGETEVPRTGENQ